jgi:hypothetical protein
MPGPSVIQKLKFMSNWPTAMQAAGAFQQIIPFERALR